MFKAVGLIGKPVTFSRGIFLVRGNTRSTLSQSPLFSESISSSCHSIGVDPVIARKSLTSTPMINYGHSASTFLTTSGRLCGIKLHSTMTRKPVIDSGSFTKGHRPCLGPRSIGPPNAYSTAQGEGKTKRSYSDGSSSFRNSVLWCWSSRMTKLILCSFAFALVPGVTFASSNNNNDKLDDKLNSSNKLTQRREVKVQPDSLAFSNNCNETTQEEHSTSSFKTGIQYKLLMLLPLRLISRVWGFINSIYLPLFIRVRVLTWYCEYFGCDLTEAELDLLAYRNLGEFFRRALKPGVRVVDRACDVVSPADGLVINFGRVDNDRIEQVKGVDYSLKAFLGPINWQPGEVGIGTDYTPLQYRNKLLQSSEGTCLYHCVIYLAPGDYHRFHSPTEWSAIFRRHFTGKLYPVRPSFMSWCKDLFSTNERVSYMGYWKYGFFSLTAVGATNVGSVKVYSDPTLVTNNPGYLMAVPSYDSFISAHKKHVRGAPFGEFNLGSTIVLIFEAPTNLNCSVKPGDRIKYGQSLFSVAQKHSTQSSSLSSSSSS